MRVEEKGFRLIKVPIRANIGLVKICKRKEVGMVCKAKERAGSRGINVQKKKPLVAITDCLKALKP